jgi:release factor glutamine methyltransferase
MTLREAIGAAAARLSPNSATPRLDAELLAAHALGISRETLLLQHLGADVPDGFAGLIDRRAAGEPVAYIVGHRDFWTITLDVAPGVLIPRPDSETLIEAAVAHFGHAGPANVLDLGTGSGALLLAALQQWPDARGLGIDQSETAVAIASANALKLGLSDRGRIAQGNWDEGISDRFDLILCNPPYIVDDEVLPVDVGGYEPASALFAGKDGLDAYRLLAPRVGRLLSPRGLALFEIGASQADAVSALLRAEGHNPRLLHDLAGRDRCIAIGPMMNFDE